MQKAILINGKTIQPGESAQVKLNTYELPTKTVIEVPVYVFRSKKDGPIVLLQAGMHGDEINGIEIIRRLLSRDDIKNPLCGTILLIPIINTTSFLYGSRELPDGRDLNRCFPGTKTGSLGSQVAYDLMNIIIPQIDFGVDFHTGGAKISNYPQLRCVFDNVKNVELSKIFGAPFTINSPYRDKTLRKEAEKKGKTILVFEGGESSRYDYISVTEGMNGCLRFLKKLNMVNVEVPENKSIVIEKTSWIRARISGLFHCTKPNGSLVKKNETIGYIADPYSEKEVKLKSHVRGYIIGINNNPITHQGDALIHIGIKE